MKVTISIDEELLKRIDKEAQECYLARSSIITLACSEYLFQRASRKSLIETSGALNRLVELCESDEGKDGGKVGKC